MTPAKVDRVIDARGMPCPGPLMSLIGAIREAALDDIIEVSSTDEGSRTDIPAWLEKAGHELVTVIEESDGSARFVVRKAR